MSKIYNVSIYKSLTGRFCVRHPSGIAHPKDFASKTYAKQFCKRQSWTVVDQKEITRAALLPNPFETIAA